MNAGEETYSTCRGCGRMECECDDPWDGEDDRDDEDLDADGEPFWCYADKRPRLCCDDLCHGAQRCMSKPRPWESVELEEEKP